LLHGQRERATRGHRARRQPLRWGGWWGGHPRRWGVKEKNRLSVSLEPASFPAFRWSGRRDLNPRRPPWQGGTLPLSYSRNGSPLLVCLERHVKWEQDRA